MIIGKILLNKIIVEEEHIIRYICQFNQCNSQTLTDSLVNIVKKDFYLQSMKDSLILSLKYDDEYSNLSEQILLTTPPREIADELILFNKSNKLINHFLFLIFIIYFILFDI